jgi:hypothetical protein
MSDINQEMNYTVGRGRLYFDLFKAGTNQGLGERYFGNTPEFGPSNETEMLDHYSSEAGIREKDASVMLQVDQNGSFTCDNITMENMALFFLGELQRQTLLASQFNVSTFADAKRGRHFQIGITDATPSGVNHVDNVVVGYAAADAVIPNTGELSTIPEVTVIPQAGNYEVDLRRGRVYLELDSPDFPAGSQLVVGHDIKGQARDVVLGKNNTLYGSLRFISDNPVGENRDYYYPKVALAPDGDYQLKGDEWQVMGFTFQALKLGNRNMVYITSPDQDVVDEIDPAEQRTITVVAASTTGTVGTPVTVTATVRDGYNNVVSGDTVNFTTGANGTVTPNSGVTDVSGQVTTDLDATAAATLTVTATVDTFSGQSQAVTFTV